MPIITAPCTCSVPAFKTIFGRLQHVAHSKCMHALPTTFVQHNAHVMLVFRVLLQRWPSFSWVPSGVMRPMAMAGMAMRVQQ